MTAKRSGAFLGCALGVAASVTTVLADSADDGTYKVIVSRNVFGLVPIPPPVVVTQPPPPLPQIVVQGITTLPGRATVVFKATTLAKPGQPAREDSYVLGEGGQADEFQVLQIDLKGRKVRFLNHGTEQMVDLNQQPAEKAGPSGPPAVAQANFAPPAAPAPVTGNPEHIQPAMQRTPEQTVLQYEARRAMHQKDTEAGLRPKLPVHPYLKDAAK